MFTGIIKHLATVKSIETLSNGLEVWFEVSDKRVLTGIGDSISLNGVCSTIVELKENQFKVLYLEETLKKSDFSSLKLGSTLNLEPALRLNDLIGGHLISGHVDAVGRIEKLEQGDPWGEIRVSFPREFAVNIVEKGSIAIDGMSLTLVDIDDNSFSCHLIPHTFENTVLNSKTVLDNVNLEFDMIGKYILRQQLVNNS